MTEIMEIDVGKKIASKIFELLGKALTKHVSEKIKQHERVSFAKEIEEWSNNYVASKPHTLLVSDAFYQYLRYHDPIEKIIEFIPSHPDQPEDDFLDEIYNGIIDYLQTEAHRNPNLEDERYIKEFIEKIFQKNRKFYECKVPTSVIAHYYATTQNGKAIKQNGDVIERVEKKLDKALELYLPKDIPVFTKQIYTAPDNMIPRELSLYRNIQEGFYFSMQTEDMLEVCRREKHIVLLGEAGCGKTIALNQLAARICETEYYPLYIALCDYVDKDIDEMIEDLYPNIDYSNLFLIFDAYDEVQEDDIKKFTRHLNQFASKNSETIIVISTRKNFYTFADKDKKSSFTGFTEYGIAPITKEQIQRYLEKNCIDSAEFFSEIMHHGLYELLKTPFYLSELIGLFKKHPTLPSKVNLMKEIIESRFNDDQHKYIQTADIAENEAEIFSCLEKLAFTLQCMKAIKITNKDYQVLVDREERDLIKYSGIFTKNARNEWSFEHNNFREYLAAAYINTLEFDKAKALVFTPENQVKPSWLNVLSYWILIREDDDLLEFVRENDMEVFVRFEHNRVPEEERTDIVIKILQNFADKNIWLANGLNDGDTLAKFGQSGRLCNYLLDQIANPCHFRAQSNAMSVLSNFSNLYGMNDRIRNVLFESLKSDHVRADEKNDILNTFVSLKLQSSEVTDYITGIFNAEPFCVYRLGIFQYLHRSGLYEKYIDLYIGEYEKANFRTDYFVRINREIREVFGKVKESGGLCKVLTVVAKSEDSHSDDMDMYDSLISNAVELYHKSHHEILDTIVCILSDMTTYTEVFVRHILEFFDKTLTRETVFMRLVDESSPDEPHIVSYTLQQIGDESCYKLLLSQYCENPKVYENVVKSLAQRFDENSTIFRRYQKTLAENNVVLPERRKMIDSQKLEKEGTEKYIECLFSKEAYLELTNKLLARVGNNTMTVSELKEINYFTIYCRNDRNTPEGFAVHHLYHRITSNFGNDDVMIESIEGIQDWKYYIAFEFDQIIGRNISVDLTDEQYSFFEEYCHALLRGLNYLRDVSDTHYSNALIIFIHLSEYFNIKYPKEVYQKMLVIPYIFFKPRDGKDAEYHHSFPSYITEKLTQDELTEYVRLNLQNGGMCRDALITHIQYCKQNWLDYGIPAAEAFCLKESNDYWQKGICAEYISELKGYQYLYDKFLDTTDLELLKAICDVTLKYADPRLLERLERIAASDVDEKILNALISMQSRYGVHQYYELAKAEMKSNPKGGDYHYVFRSIAKIDDIDLLHEIDALRALLFTPDFKDPDDFGLKNRLYDAYMNLARVDDTVVMEHLTVALQKTDINEKEKTFCNMLFTEIEQLRSEKYDVKWTIQQIKEFWRSSSLR